MTAQHTGPRTGALLSVAAAAASLGITNEREVHELLEARELEAVRTSAGETRLTSASLYAYVRRSAARWREDVLPDKRVSADVARVEIVQGSVL